MNMIKGAPDVSLRPWSVLSLCTGYGGLERAIALACPGVRLVGAVERQAYAAAVLASRMVAGAVDSCPIWDDLESFDGSAYRDRVDLVVAGFPCQGASSAGKRLGIDDERWLWPEVWRITQAVGARWLLVENVPGLLSVNGGGAFAEILRDLGACGWDAEWDCVPAAGVGAPHIRDRLFLLAAGLGAIPRDRAPEGDRVIADADNAGRARERRRRKLDTGVRPQRRSDTNGHRGAEVGDAIEHHGPVIDIGRTHWDWGLAPEPCLRGVADGIAGGMVDSAHADRLYLLGNGVVPQAAALAVSILWERLHGTALAVDQVVER